MPKLTEITPPHLRCSIGACPAIHETEGEKLLIIGKKPSDELMADLEGKVGEDEVALVIDKAMVMPGVGGGG